MSDCFELNDHLRRPDARCKLLAVINHAQDFNSAHGKVNISINRGFRALTQPCLFRQHPARNVTRLPCRIANLRASRNEPFHEGAGGLIDNAAILVRRVVPAPTQAAGQENRRYRE